MPKQAVPDVQARLHRYVTDFKPTVTYGWVAMLRLRIKLAELRALSK